MQVIVMQDSSLICCIWAGDVVLVKNKSGLVVPQRRGRLLGRLTKEFCKKIYGCVPRPNTAVRFEVTNLGKVEIEKQK